MGSKSSKQDVPEPSIEQNDQPQPVSINNATIRTKPKPKSFVNDFDVEFNWNEEDPWLGVDVETGYVKMSLPKHPNFQNENFYFMYKSQQKENPKVLVLLAGGPCYTVLMKAFNRFNP